MRLVFAICFSSFRDRFCIFLIWSRSFCERFCIFAIRFSPFCNRFCPFLICSSISFNRFIFLMIGSISFCNKLCVSLWGGFCLGLFCDDLTYLYYVEKPFFIRQWVTKLVFTEKKSNNTWLTYIISLLLFFKISSTALILLILAISFDSFQNYLMKMIIQQINTIKNEVVFWNWYFLQRFTKFSNNTICFATQHNFYVITLCVYWLVSVLGCNEL